MVTDRSNHFIDFEVESAHMRRWRYTGFYGCHEKSRRRESWDIIRHLASKSNLPWCITGDFNDLMSVDEKKGGGVHPSYLLSGFAETINDCELLDMGYVGEKFTWERSRGQWNWVQERSDRAYANHEWRTLFPNVVVRVLDVSTSDHLPLEKDCKNVVRNGWKMVEGLDIMEKIRLCSVKLQEWGGGSSNKYKVKLRGCRERLRRLRSRRDMTGTREYNEVRKEYMKLLERQEIYWQQRAKQFWLREGDQNTLSSSNGKLSEFERVGQVSERDNINLIENVTEEEVKHAVFSMHPDKSPGPDGLNPAFFQVFWEVVARDVVRFCQNFISNVELPGEVNQTQVVNFNKSTVTFSPNTSRDNRAKVCAQLGVKEVDTPGKYLGLPMDIGRSKTSAFAFLLEKMNKKLNAWSHHTLSKGGKLTLLKTSAQSIPNFWMSLRLIPTWVCDKLERVMNAYYWSNGGTHKGIKWMSWDRLCAIKDAGGLGFKKLREFNVAMLAKQAWRLINNVNPLVTKLIKAKYFPKSDFLDASLGDAIYMWKSIMEAQEVVKQGCRRRIGDGLSKKVWRVPWLPNSENGFITTEMHEEWEHVLVNHLFDETGTRWDEDILYDLFNERDRRLIMQIPLSLRNTGDRWTWMFEDKGNFSVKSCYRRLRGEVECIDKRFWNRLWHLQLPGKDWTTARDQNGGRQGVKQSSTSKWIRPPTRINRCVFETDCKGLVDAIHGQNDMSVFGLLVEDCKDLLKHFEEMFVIFVRRSGNSVEHVLAQAARSMSGLREWHNATPDFITCNLELDLY
ncbi:hypothetical protein AgCh_022054 [Apium graveolens]